MKSLLLLVVIISFPAMAKLSPEKVQAAQELANKIFSLNKAVSSSLYGDVILRSSPIDFENRIDYRLFADNQDWQTGEFRYNVSNHKIDDSTDLSETVKSCVLLQAKELERLNKLRKEIPYLFKALKLYIQVFDNKYYEPLEPNSYLVDASSFSWMGIGDHGNYVMEVEHGLDIEVDLNVHLDRDQPCSVVKAEDIEKRLGGLTSDFESTVR